MFIYACTSCNISSTTIIIIIIVDITFEISRNGIQIEKQLEEFLKLDTHQSNSFESNRKCDKDTREEQC